MAESTWMYVLCFINKPEWSPFFACYFKLGRYSACFWLKIRSNWDREREKGKGSTIEFIHYHQLKINQTWDNGMFHCSITTGGSKMPASVLYTDSTIMQLNKPKSPWQLLWAIVTSWADCYIRSTPNFNSNFKLRLHTST